MYTIFQMCFFAGIFVVMNIPAISIAFPFMTFLCIPARLFFFPKIFAGWELTVLDGEEDALEHWVQLKQDSMRGFTFDDAEPAKNDRTKPMDADSEDDQVRDVPLSMESEVDDISV